MANKFILAIFISTVLLLPGCAGLVQAVLQPPKVDVDSVNLVGMDLKGLDLNINLKVDNPNSTPVQIDKIKYNFSIGESSLFSGIFDKTVELKAKNITFVTIPIKLNYESAKVAVENYIFKSIKEYKFNAQLTSGILTIPINSTGNIEGKK
ncbi:MAG: LEA type 2 family protein [Bdellovibrionaceae bacterium]|nr:LEA type 2 family protein [Pseudobdellovibrionaceae bacterium]